MDYLESVEVRWFLEPSDPCVAPINAWLGQVPIDTKELERADYYFRTATPAIGVKYRTSKKGARFETKYLVGALPGVTLGGQIVGDIERWNKVSVDVTNDPRAAGDERWVTVFKERRIQKFHHSAEGARKAAPEEYPAAGCGLEWTRLKVEHDGTRREVWTMGLEAFGPPEVLLDALQTTLRVALREVPDLRLGRERSLSYPTWLATLTPPKQ